MQDIKEVNDSLLFKIPDKKNYNPKSFVLTGRLLDFINNYRELRPKNATNDKFLIQYIKGRCVNQVCGINKIGEIPKVIAVFLNLENPNSYLEHSFRRTSATLLVDAGPDIIELKRHGGWKSDAVAMGYLGKSMGNK